MTVGDAAADDQAGVRARVAAWRLMAELLDSQIQAERTGLFQQSEVDRGRILSDLLAEIVAGDVRAASRAIGIQRSDWEQLLDGHELTGWQQGARELLLRVVTEDARRDLAAALIDGAFRGRTAVSMPLFMEASVDTDDAGLLLMADAAVAVWLATRHRVPTREHERLIEMVKVTG